jgi:hypothetical protein
LVGKKYFSFLDGFSGYKQIRIAIEDQEKMAFTCPWWTYAYKGFPFECCYPPATFQREILAIFVGLVDGCSCVYGLLFNLWRYF